jgi:TPP-dependent indolepyruvate ferredoxin oxidoreductase alpha subunit
VVENEKRAVNAKRVKSPAVDNQTKTSLSGKETSLLPLRYECYLTILGEGIYLRNNSNGRQQNTSTGGRDTQAE